MRILWPFLVTTVVGGIIVVGIVLPILAEYAYTPASVYEDPVARL